MKKTFAQFDPAACLDNDEVIAENLTAAAEDPNPDVFLAALGDIAKARGMQGWAARVFTRPSARARSLAMKPSTRSCTRSASNSRLP
jgi:probable addiction module antidote protein